MRHDECQACMGNVMDGMTCHACGLKGPKGEGWAFVAMDLRARLELVERHAASVRNAWGSDLLAAGQMIDRLKAALIAAGVHPNMVEKIAGERHEIRTGGVRQGDAGVS